jgi:hypothetical protein
MPFTAFHMVAALIVKPASGSRLSLLIGAVFNSDKDFGN